jgi:cobalt-zinc-cadmium resistance protein CzcA
MLRGLDRVIQRIVDFAIDQRFVTIALVLILGAFGIYAYRQVPVEAFPDLDDVHVRVIVLWPGQASEEVESLVTRPTEQQLNGTPGLISLRSVSQFGLSLVTLTFEDDVSDNFARAQVLEKMQGVSLPQGASWQLAALSESTGEIYRYVIDGQQEPLYELRALEDWVIEPQLRQVPGVADVVPFGGGVKQYQVVVDPMRLLQHKVTLPQLFTALQNNNANTGGNVLGCGEQMYTIRSVGMLSSIADIGDVWIASQDGHPIYVRDVADVRIDMAPREGMFAWYDSGAGAKPRERDDMIEGIVSMRKGLNAQKVADAISEKVRYLNEVVLPRGVRMIPIYDRRELVQHTVRTVVHNLAEGALLILAICLVFTSNLRASIVIWLVIPPALLTTLIVLLVDGTPANLLSFGAVDFGILVDATVVIVEAILVRRLLAGPGADFKEICRTTTGHLGRAMIFTQAIFITALIPIFTFQRVEGRIFKPMALTITSAVVGATIMSITLVPLAASAILRSGSATHDNRVGHVLKRAYGAALELALRHKVATVTTAAVLLLASLALATRLGTEFLPRLDEGNIWLKCTMPLSISKEQAKATERRIREILKGFPESRVITTQLGRPEDGTDVKGYNNLEVAVYLAPIREWTTAHDKEGLIEAMKAKLEELPGVEYGFSQYIEDNVDEALSGVQGELAIKLFGENLEVLREKGEEIRKVVGGVRGVADLAIDQLLGQPSLGIRLDRAALARYGVDVQTVQALVRTGLGGEAAGSLLEGQRSFDISVRLAPSERDTAERISNLWIDTPSGQRIPLENLARIVREEGASRIGRDRNSRRVAIRCNVRGRDMGGFVAEAQRRVREDVSLPAGYLVTWEGQFENQQRATSRLAIIVPLSFLGIVGLLFWAFNRLRYALLIIANIPFALIGGITLLFVTHTNLSVSAMIGFIALSGVSVQNGLILVGQFNSLRAKGKSLRESVLEGGRARVRPVLMTALMASLGLYPAAVSQGIGSEVQRPLALVIVGGMLSAVALTLFVLPAIYEWLEIRLPAQATIPKGMID